MSSENTLEHKFLAGYSINSNHHCKSFHPLVFRTETPIGERPSNSSAITLDPSRNDSGMQQLYSIEAVLSNLESQQLTKKCQRFLRELYSEKSSSVLSSTATGNNTDYPTLTVCWLRKCSQLANELRIQMALAEAITMMEHVTVLYEMYFPSHLEYASALLDIAECYRRMSSYHDAIQAAEQALHIRNKRCGPNHPLTAMAMNTLAIVYRAASQDQEAASMTKKALRIFEEHALAKERMKDLDTGQVASMSRASALAHGCFDPWELHDDDEVMSLVTVRNLDTGESAQLNQANLISPHKIFDPKNLHSDHELLAAVPARNLDTGECVNLLKLIQLQAQYDNESVHKKPAKPQLETRKNQRQSACHRSRNRWTREQHLSDNGTVKMQCLRLVSVFDPSSMPEHKQTHYPPRDS